MSRNNDESKVRHAKDKLKYTLSKYDIGGVELPQFIDIYNLTMTTNGISGTILTRISEGNNWYVIIDEAED